MDWSTTGQTIQVVFDELFLSQNPMCCEDTPASDLIDQMLQHGCLAGGGLRDNKAISRAGNKDDRAPIACSDTKPLCPYKARSSLSAYEKSNAERSRSNDAKSSNLPSTNSEKCFKLVTKLSLRKPRRKPLQDIEGKNNPVCIENKPKPSKTDSSENVVSDINKRQPETLNDINRIPTKLRRSNGTAASVEDLKVFSSDERKTIDLAWGSGGLLIQKAFDQMFNHVTQNSTNGSEILNLENSNEKPEVFHSELIKPKSKTDDNITHQLGVDPDSMYNCHSANKVGEYGSLYTGKVPTGDRAIPYTGKVQTGDRTIPQQHGEAETEKDLSPKACHRYGDDVAMSLGTNEPSLVARKPEHTDVLPPVPMLSGNVGNSSSDSLSVRSRLRPRRNIQPVDRNADQVPVVADCHADQVPVIADQVPVNDCAADISCYSDRLLQSGHVYARSRVARAHAVVMTQKVKMAVDSTDEKAQVVQRVSKPACPVSLEQTKTDLRKNKTASRTNIKQAQRLRKNISKSRNGIVSVKKCVGKKYDPCFSCEDERKKGRNKRLMRTRDLSVTSFDGKHVSWNSRIQKQTLSHGKGRGCYKKPTRVTRQTVLALSCNDAKKLTTVRNVPVGDMKSAKVNRQSKPTSSRYIAKKQTRTCNIPACDPKPIRLTRQSQLSSSRYQTKKQTTTQIIPLTETKTKCSRSTNCQVPLTSSLKTKKYKSFKFSQQKQFKRPKKITLTESKTDRNKRKDHFKRANKLTPPESRKQLIKHKEQLKRPRKKTVTENKKGRCIKRPEKRQNKIILPQKSNTETNSIILTSAVRSEKQKFRKTEHPVKSTDVDVPALLTGPSDSNELVRDWLWSCQSVGTAEQNIPPAVSADHQLDYSMTPAYPATNRLFGLDNLQSYLGGYRDDTSRPTVDPQSHVVLSQGIGSLFSSSGHAGEVWKSIV